jgi:hypothetical protein
MRADIADVDIDDRYLMFLIDLLQICIPMILPIAFLKCGKCRAHSTCFKWLSS